MTDYPTFGVKYLGSKRKLLPMLAPIFDDLTPRTALDVFTGTTRVAQMLRRKGLVVTTSDVSDYSRVFSRAWVSGRYDSKTVEYWASKLDRIPGVEGWFTRNYCDVPGVRGGVVRFMQRKNGMRVDAIRDEIEALRSTQRITDDEAWYLVAMLMMAMDRVDNTVGVQQAYLKGWCKRSHDDMRMQVYHANQGPLGSHIVGDVLEVQLPTADVAYLDPPYSAAPYRSYYHIWESIARWDKPEVDLKTNRRVDACYGKATSPWNRVKTAPRAFRTLLSRLDVGHVVMSYGGSSVISLEELTDIVAETHEVQSISTISVGENIMSKIGNGELSGMPKPPRVEQVLVAKAKT